MQLQKLASASKDKDPLAAIHEMGSIECGEDAARHFAFDEGYSNLNHGSYGSTPNEVMEVHRHFRMKAERRPDAFVRYEYRTHLLDHARKQVADYVAVPLETCVLVQNATIAFDTVVRNLIFEPGDVILYFAPIYDAFYHTVKYLSETTPVKLEKIDYTLPVSDDYICSTFESKVRALKAGGSRPVLAIFDTVSSLPAARMPFERLTDICRANNILSCIDGAHGIGQFPLDLSTLDPDFFTSNCHKWLHVPRPCGFLYVPVRNQHLLRATLPTGFNFVPQPDPPNFVANFASLSTLDDTPYVCIEAALLWRSKVKWKELQGEEAIMAYTKYLATEGGKRVAEILDTEIMDNEQSTIADCSMTNVRLPLDVHQLSAAEAIDVARAAMEHMIVHEETPVNIVFYGGVLWVRLSAQIYLTSKDFERAGEQLKALCAKFRKFPPSNNT